MAKAFGEAIIEAGGPQAEVVRKGLLASDAEPHIFPKEDLAQAAIFQAANIAR